MSSDDTLAPGAVGSTRRDRQRQRVLTEIKDAALVELREHGAAGVTMRAVARAIDITPSGLYRYVEGHEALLSLLAKDSLGELGDLIVAAQDAVARRGHAARWYQGALAMREWSIAHPAQYGLVFDTEPARAHALVGGVRENPAFAAFSQVCADALADHAIDPDLTAMLSDASDDLDVVHSRAGIDDTSRANAAADVLAATGLACLLGHLSIEIGGRLDSDISNEERFQLFARGVMRLLGFTREATLRQPSHAAP